MPYAFDDPIDVDTDETTEALAGLDSTPGLVEQTGADAFTKRALGVAASTSIPTRADADARFQPLSAVLTATTASFTTADETKLGGVEALADVTDAANVAAAGAIMDGDFGSNGLMVRTGAGAYSPRTLTAGNGASVADGTGAAGNPTVSINPAKVQQFVATYAALTALVTNTGLIDNGIYYTYGRSAEEDGGSGFWRYDSASTATADGGTILAIDGGGAGRFFRLYDGVALVEWWGVKNDNSTNDYDAIVLAVNACKTSGIALDWGGGRGKRAKVNTALAFTGPGTFNWINPSLNGADVAASGTILTVDGEALGSAINLTVNAVAGDSSVTVASTTGIVADDYIVLQSDAYFDGEDVARKGEYVRVLSVTSTVITLYTPIRGSYATANTARVRKYATTTTLRVCGRADIAGGGSADDHYGLRVRRVFQPWLQGIKAADCAQVAVSWEMNYGGYYGPGEYYDGLTAGWGYGVEVIGCVGLEVASQWGRRLRHVVTLSASYSSNNHNNFPSRDIRVGNIHGEECLSNPFDSHSGVCGFKVGHVTGTMADSVTTQEAFLVEGACGDIESVDVRGAVVAGFGIVTNGHTDDAPNYMRVGSVRADQDATGTYMLFITNNSDRDSRPFQVSIGSINGRGDFGLTTAPNQGDIILDIGQLHLRVKQTGIYLTSTASYRTIGKVGTIVLYDDGSNAVYPIYLDGSTYEAANPGRFGVTMTISDGLIEKTGSAAEPIRVNDAQLIVGNGVRMTYGTSAAALIEGIGTWQRQSRETLSSNRTYYVRSDGANTNSGLANSASGAFLTIAKALTTAESLDLNGFTVTIDLANDTYTTPIVAAGFSSQGVIRFEGDTSTPSNVIISTTSADAFKAENIAGKYELRGVRLQTTTSGNGIAVYGQRVQVSWENVDFGAIGGSDRHIFAGDFAFAYASGNYSISGAAGSHMYAVLGAQIDIAGRTVTLTGTPAITTFAQALRLGMVNAPSVTFSGSATATQYSATEMGFIKGNGSAGYFPGATGGATATGGTYA